MQAMARCHRIGQRKEVTIYRHSPKAFPSCPFGWRALLRVPCTALRGAAEAAEPHRLITRRTYEAEMFDRAAKKLGLDQAVFGGSQVGRTQHAAGSVQRAPCRIAAPAECSSLRRRPTRCHSAFPRASTAPRCTPPRDATMAMAMGAE